MPKNRILYLALIAVFTVVAGILVYNLAHEAIREVLINAYKAGHTLVSLIPQPLLWGVLILVILTCAARSLLGDEDRRVTLPALPDRGRAAEWRDWLERSGHRAGYRSFYRWQTARNLARLASEVIAHQKGISPGEAERQIEEGEVALPAGVRAYFLASMRSRPNRYSSWRSRWSGPAEADPLDLDPIEAVNLIETQLEVSHDDRNLGSGSPR